MKVSSDAQLPRYRGAWVDRTNLGLYTCKVSAAHSQARYLGSIGTLGPPAYPFALLAQAKIFRWGLSLPGMRAAHSSRQITAHSFLKYLTRITIAQSSQVSDKPAAADGSIPEAKLGQESVTII
eukprot:3864126-Rhodomonas_salina.1